MEIREQIMRALENAADLPTLPTIALKINDMLSRADVSADDVARVMAHDPALTARVLRVANSAAFGASAPIPTVAAAVTRLGLREVRNMVFSMSVIQAFKPTAGVVYPRFWRHAISTAFAARVMRAHAVKLIESTGDDTLFTAGILHDIGVLMLDLYAGDFYRRVTRAARAADLDLYESERKVLHTDHAEIGALLLQRWNLPEVIVQAVRWHHEPCRAESGADMPVVHLTHLANFVCNNQGIDNGLSGFPVKFSEAAWFDTGLPEDAVPEIISQVKIETAKSEVLTAAAQND